MFGITTKWKFMQCMLSSYANICSVRRGRIFLSGPVFGELTTMMSTGMHRFCLASSRKRRVWCEPENKYQYYNAPLHGHNLLELISTNFRTRSPRTTCLFSTVDWYFLIEFRLPFQKWTDSDGQRRFRWISILYAKHLLYCLFAYKYN